MKKHKVNRDRWIFEHQLDQIVTYLSWGMEWVGDATGDEPEGYDSGSAEALGHLLSCWLVQVAGLEDCETAVGRDILFTDKLMPRPIKAVIHRIRAILLEADVEIVKG